MEIHQEKAYIHLTEQEKLVLSFIIINNRSFKETAAIVDISPYKIKEVYFRAKKYFLLFTDFYRSHDELFPNALAINPLFKDYITELIQSRKNPAELKRDPKYFEICVSYKLKALWRDLFEALAFSGRLHYTSLYNLILEFDKWADKRILPKAFQKPSAFERRRIKVFKKVFKEMTSFGDLGYDLMQQLHGDKKGKGFIIAFYDKGHRLIRIKLTKGSIEYYTNLHMPVFVNEPQAIRMADLVQQFKTEKTNTRRAAIFWSNFRVLAMQAVNIEEIMGIKREEFVDISQKDRDFLARIKEKTFKKVHYRKSQDDLFW